MNDLYCVEWDVKPYSTQPELVNVRFLHCELQPSTAADFRYCNLMC